MELSFVEIEVESEGTEQLDRSRISTLGEYHLALVGGGIGSVELG